MVAQLLQLLFCAFLLLKPTEALATRGVFGLQHAPHRSLGVARARSSLPLKSVVECKDEACNFVEEVVTASKDTFVIVDFYAGIFLTICNYICICMCIYTYVYIYTIHIYIYVNMLCKYAVMCTFI